MHDRRHTTSSPALHIVRDGRALHVSRSAIPELIGRMESARCPWLRPLYAAAGEGLLDVVLVEPGHRIPSALIDPLRQRLPRCVIAGDDGAIPCGPEGFPQAAQLMRWARAVMVHAAGGKPEHYASAASAATFLRRCLVVETNTHHAEDWVAFTLAHARPDARLLAIATRPGVVHPVAEARA